MSHLALGIEYFNARRVGRFTDHSRRLAVEDCRRNAALIGNLGVFADSCIVKDVVRAELGRLRQGFDFNYLRDVLASELAEQELSFEVVYWVVGLVGNVDFDQSAGVVQVGLVGLELPDVWLVREF